MLSGHMQQFTLHAGRPCVASRRRCSLTVTAKKGFGEAGGKDAAQVKVSKRGKVASRPSMEKQLERLQADEREYQAAMKAKLAARQASSEAAQPSSTFETDSTPVETSAPTVPEQITDRMLRRMLTFSIAPVFVGFTLFPLFYYLKKVQGIDLPVWAVYIVQTTIFAGGLAGISYGVLSSSWDPRREGSALGWDEFKANLPVVLERFRKND